MISFGRLSFSRRDIGLRKWVNWLREDLSSGLYAWLRPDFVPPSPFSCCQGSSDQVVSDFS